MNEIILSQNSSATISTIDFRDKINELRAGENETAIRNDRFIARVESEVDDLGVCQKMTHPQSGVEMRYYDLNQDQMILVGMRESKTVRKQVLSWLHTLAKPQVQLPGTFAEALQLAADQAKQLELAAPKVAFVENLVERHTLMTATEVGQKHKMSAIKLNQFLDELGGVYTKNVKRKRVFLQPFIDKGYGEVKQNEAGHSQALFTPAGEVWINEKLISEGVV